MATTNLPEGTQTVQFDQALLQATARAKATYPAEKCRIERGLSLAISGAVTLHADGSATVQSQTEVTTHYHVNGACECRDGMVAPGGRCKHRWAKSLVRFAQKALAEAPTFIYYASYYAPDESCTQGTAQYVDGHGWLFIPADGGDMLYASMLALVLGGRVDILETQRDKDGNLAAKVCGYR